jgi:hypothetical protein
MVLWLRVIQVPPRTAGGAVTAILRRRLGGARRPAPHGVLVCMGQDAAHREGRDFPPAYHRYGVGVFSILRLLYRIRAGEQRTWQMGLCCVF